MLPLLVLLALLYCGLGLLVVGRLRVLVLLLLGDHAMVSGSLALWFLLLPLDFGRLW